MDTKTIPSSTGVVTQVDVSGVGLIEDDSTHHKYPFTFDTVKGYFGQPLSTAGLEPGAPVKFHVEGGIIKFVVIEDAGKRW